MVGGGEAYLHGSHVSKEVIVIVSAQPLYPGGDAELFPSVRVESRVVRVEITVKVYTSNVKLDGVSLGEDAVKLAGELGWSEKSMYSSDSTFRIVLTKIIDNNRCSFLSAWRDRRCLGKGVGR